MTPSEILGCVITVLSFALSLWTLGAKLVARLEKLKSGQDFLREELQEFQIDMRERIETLDARLRDTECRLSALSERETGPALPGYPCRTLPRNTWGDGTADDRHIAP